MAYGDADVAAMLAHAMGEDLWLEGVRTRALFDEADTAVETGLGLDVLVEGTSARIATGSLPGLARDVTVRRGDREGPAYVVRDLRRLNDGALTLLVLAEA